MRTGLSGWRVREREREQRERERGGGAQEGGRAQEEAQSGEQGVDAQGEAEGGEQEAGAQKEEAQGGEAGSRGNKERVQVQPGEYSVQGSVEERRQEEREQSGSGEKRGLWRSLKAPYLQARGQGSSRERRVQLPRALSQRRRRWVLGGSDSEADSMETVGSEVDEVEMREEAGPLKRLAEEGEGSEERAKRGRGGMRERWGLIAKLSDSDTGGSSPVFPADISKPAAVCRGPILVPGAALLGRRRTDGLTRCKAGQWVFWFFTYGFK